MIVGFHYRDNTSRLMRMVDSAERRAVRRGAAYVRGVARRMVKRRKRGSSRPGEPPVAHSGIFKASILFDVDGKQAVIGPALLGTRRTNADGKPIPNILEFGGLNIPEAQGYWRRLRNVKNETQVAAHFLALGSGPGYWGNTLSALAAKIGKRARRARGGKRGHYQRWKRWSPVKGRKVYVQNIRINGSMRAARKVARTAIEIFGNPTPKAGKIAPRPLMAPALAASRANLARIMFNSI